MNGRRPARAAWAWAWAWAAYTLWFSPAFAGGELAGVELEWTAPPGCPDEASARNTIQAYLGQRALEAFKPVAVRVEITRLPTGRFRGDLSVRGQRGGDRRFEGPTCARVGEAAALIVAIMLDPVEVATQVESAAQVVPAKPSARPAASREVASEPASATNTVHIGVQAAMDIGSFPMANAGAALVLGVTTGPVLVAGEVMAWAPRSTYRGSSSETGGQFGLYTASLRGCFLAIEIPERSAGAGPCVRAEFGLSTGRGVGNVEPGASTAAWGAALLGFTVRIGRGGPWVTWVSFDGGAPFLRPTYVIEGLGTVFRAGPLLARASWGVAWTFP